jgi:GDP-mannose 6-dehydrogenase
MKISVFGLGYVGAVSVGCLAADGHDVLGVDIDPVKLDLIRNGNSPVVEEGIQDLIAKGVRAGKIAVTDGTEKAIRETELSFVCVGTPPRADGGQDLRAILGLAAELGAALKAKTSGHVVVIRSTVIPGTVEEQIIPVLENHSGKTAGEDFEVCFQPEFLREGSSIKDYYNPPFSVVGAPTERCALALREIFGRLPGGFHVTSIRTAEMLKYCCNSFHALKVNFANEIGRICQAIGVDSHEVMGLVCKDTKLNVSPAYLRPGFAFGGSCLPKDLKALLALANRENVEVPMLRHVLPSNRIHIEHAVQMVLDCGHRSVGMIGLSFKSGTDDLRESPLVVMAEQLLGKGRQLKIHDPEVQLSRLIGANRRYIEGSIPHIASLMCDACEHLIDESKVVVVGILSDKLLACLKSRLRKDHVVFDLVGIPGKEALQGEYHGVCW